MFSPKEYNIILTAIVLVPEMQSLCVQMASHDHLCTQLRGTFLPAGQHLTWASRWSLFLWSRTQHSSLRGSSMTTIHASSEPKVTAKSILQIKSM